MKLKKEQDKNITMKKIVLNLINYRKLNNNLNRNNNNNSSNSSNSNNISNKVVKEMDKKIMKRKNIQIWKERKGLIEITMKKEITKTEITITSQENIKKENTLIINKKIKKMETIIIIITTTIITKMVIRNITKKE